MRKPSLESFRNLRLFSFNPIPSSNPLLCPAPILWSLNGRRSIVDVVDNWQSWISLGSFMPENILKPNKLSLDRKIIFYGFHLHSFFEKTFNFFRSINSTQRSKKASVFALNLSHLEEENRKEFFCRIWSLSVFVSFSFSFFSQFRKILWY